MSSNANYKNTRIFFYEKNRHKLKKIIRRYLNDCVESVRGSYAQ